MQADVFRYMIKSYLWDFATLTKARGVCRDWKALITALMREERGLTVDQHTLRAAFSIGLPVAHICVTSGAKSLQRPLSSLNQFMETLVILEVNDNSFGIIKARKNIQPICMPFLRYLRIRVSARQGICAGVIALYAETPNLEEFYIRSPYPVDLFVQSLKFGGVRNMLISEINKENGKSSWVLHLAAALIHSRISLKRANWFPFANAPGDVLYCSNLRSMTHAILDKRAPMKIVVKAKGCLDFYDPSWFNLSHLCLRDFEWHIVIDKVEFQSDVRRLLNYLLVALPRAEQDQPRITVYCERVMFPGLLESNWNFKTTLDWQKSDLNKKNRCTILKKRLNLNSRLHSGGSREDN